VAFQAGLVSGASLKYLAAIDRHLPFAMPDLLRPFAEDELSFIGMAKSLLVFRDARISGRYQLSCAPAQATQARRLASAFAL
jgi:hypothetical protein